MPGGEPPGAAAGQPGTTPPPATPTPWITRWQAVLVAIVTAVGGIAVAVIAAVNQQESKPVEVPPEPVTVTTPTIGSDPQSSQKPPGKWAQLDATVSRTQLQVRADGTWTVTVSGTMEGFREAVILGLRFPTYRVVVDPVNATSGSEPSETVYFSGPLAIRPDGSWEEEVRISTKDPPQFNVYIAACSWRGEGPAPLAEVAQQRRSPYEVVIDEIISEKKRVLAR